MAPTPSPALRNAPLKEVRTSEQKAGMSSV